MNSEPVIIFDGKCHFCIGIVDFVLKRDREKFSIIPIQAPEARKLLRDRGIKFADLNTVYLVDNKEVYVRSKAAFNIFRKLPFPWSAFALFRVLPVSITDMMYKWVARNRFVFGRSDTRIEILHERYPERFVNPADDQSR